MNFRRVRRWLLLSATVTVAGFVCGAWFVGGALVVPVNRFIGSPPDDLPVESVSIESKSGSMLATWYIPVVESESTVILLHPLHGDRRSMLSRAKLLHEAGYTTLLIDFQSHGESIGSGITFGFTERHDVEAVVDFVRMRTPKHRIGIIGWSLGGAATLLASPLNVDALVFESVYPDMAQAVHNRIAIRLRPLHHVLAPALLVQLQPRLGISVTQLRPIDYIDNADCPILIIAGDIDLHTTLIETQQLFNAARDPKQLVIFEDAKHADLLAHDSPKYKSEVIGFLEKNLRSPAKESSN